MSSGIVKNASTDRIILKNYYRKTAGFMSVMNSIFMLAMAMIAFYISEYFDEIANVTADTEGGVAGILSIVAFGSLAVMFFRLGFGIAGMKREKDENFNNQRVMAMVGIALSALYVISTIVAFADGNNNIDNPENITYFLVGVCVAIVASIYDVLIIIMTTKARKYCDTKKGKAAEVEFAVDKDALKKRENAVILSAFGLILLSVWMLCLAFNLIINEYSRNLVVDLGWDGNIYMILAIIGFVGIAAVIGSIVLDVKNSEKSGIAAKITIIISLVLVVVAVIFSISTIGKEYALPMVDGKLSYLFQYYIFMYVLAGFSAILGGISLKRHL